MQIKIKKREKQDQADHFELADETAYYPVLMAEHLESSSISKVFLHYQLILDIQAFTLSSLHSVPVCEIGGFLFGASRPVSSETEDPHFELEIAHFLPDHQTDFSTPNRLVFGEEVQIQMDNIRLANPQWKVVGWWHTHPGHTPYLSSIDLYTHEGFFRKNNQVAMVLDPLTEEFDTGIFSRQPSGLVNNKPNVQQWIHWKILVDWAEQYQPSNLQTP